MRSGSSRLTRSGLEVLLCCASVLLACHTFRSNSYVGSALFWEEKRTTYVFYHAFASDLLPPIVAEQMLDVSSAFYNGGITGLYYNVAAITNRALQYRIPNCSFCHRLGSFMNGNEVDTLQSLFDHCISGSGSDQVVYIHSKGSFHPSDRNTQLRRFLMRGAFSTECLNMPSTCNVCAARFSPLPHQHVPGNMWVARCSYIKGLIPPLKFGEAMLKFDTAAHTGRADNDSSWSWGAEVWGRHEDAKIGKGRYAAEHWLGSHPGLSPCDIYSGDYYYGYKGPDDMSNMSWTPTLQAAPRYDLTVFSYTHHFKCLERLQSWRLHEFTFLYNETPSHSSWFWTYYPPANWSKVGNMSTMNQSSHVSASKNSSRFVGCTSGPRTAPSMHATLINVQKRTTTPKMVHNMPEDGRRRPRGGLLCNV
ncbi:unnamed protein product [Prorocentrum cordatum]|uniref:Phospholipase B-like n=1 Tax=Prorocentrum cordatum TaxID=2364126 RepID=A0ABN9U351_9DINO|nr:unnamed protein product [Polarella glacialis]